MTGALEIGTAVHKCLEEWLRDGLPFPITRAGIIAKKGLPFLPPPSKDLRVELTDVVAVPGADVQFRRTIDLFDPVEPRLYDHKTFTDARHIPTVAALLTGVQSTSYAMWGLDHLQVDSLAATWLYYPKAGGNAVPVDLMFEREPTAKRWAQTLSNAIKMADLLEKSPTACDTNHDACNDYNRQCPFYAQCRGHENKKGDTMNLLDKIKRNLPITETPAAVVAAPTLLERQLVASILPPDAPADTYETMPVEEPKKSRAKRAPTAPHPTGDLELWIGAMRDGQPHVKIETLAWAIADKVAQDNGVSHFGLVEYSRGGPMLAAAFAEYLDANPPSLPVFVDRVPSTIGKAVLEVLVRKAGHNILRGV